MKIKSITKTLFVLSGVTILSLATTQISASENRPTFSDAKPVENNKFVVKSLWSKEIFGFNTEGSHSYRIPGIIKTNDGRLMINADKRVENIEDYGNTIEQVQKISHDNGETWTNNQTIVRIANPKTNKGLIIDGTYVEASHNGQNKLIYLFNMFAERAGIPDLLEGNPWLFVEGQAYLKVWLRDNGIKFNSDNYVFKELTNKPGWLQMYKLDSKLKHDQIKSANQLIATNTYVDNSYNSETRTITGQVYENVSESDFNNPIELAKKATQHGIYDKYANGTKYMLAKNNHNGTLESLDGGLTWNNFQMIDKQLRTNGSRSSFSGNAVGSGIQLKNQSNKNLNGRIFLPMYDYHKGLQKAYFIYSDDGGTTWIEKRVPGLQRNSMESTFIETEDGALYWFQRQAIWGSSNRASITKSTDGGLTWFNPSNPTSKQIFKKLEIKADGNIFAGLSHFKLKGKDYFLFALAKGEYRYAGSVYITDSSFDEYTEVYSFDTKNHEHFAYNYPITINVTENYADILIAYEWSHKTKIFNTDKFNNHRPKGGGIQLDKLRVSLK